MNLSNCNIVEFPKFLKNLPNLQLLDISNNNLKGKVPGWLWNRPLALVFLSHNSLDGFEGSPQMPINLPLEVLDLSSNAFRGSFPILPPTIEFVVARNNSFTGELPLSLCSPKKLSFLDLSHNNFSGPIPQCLGDSVDGVMILGHNNLTGQLPDLFCRSGSLKTLDVSNNQISGELPDIFCRSDSLRTLDVSHNQISGKLPRSLVNSTELVVLNVESNRITDTFPFWLKALPDLKGMFLRSNRFYGPISSLGNPLSFPALRLIDISSNKFNGSMPSNYFVNWSMSEYLGDSYLTLFDHPSVILPLLVPWRIKRLEMESEVVMMINGIDFSSNKFDGQIPESIGLLKSLTLFNLSNNGFTGHIPSSLANLTFLESLDLSQNQLSGTIPPELGSLTFLAYLNVSNNNLTGKIPEGTQIIGQPKSSFERNINLCGLPLEKSCLGKNGAHSPHKQHEKPLKREHVSKAATIGYRPTLMMFVLGIGHVISSYAPNWFIYLFHF